jgi:phosphomevalonate kinase
MSVTASAPGKLVLSGEYAVLDGAPAVCMAVDRRARVTLATTDNDWHTVTAPGFSDATGRFNVVDGKFEWLMDGKELRLVEHVWQTANTKMPGHVSLTLDSSEFKDDQSGIKFGIGSSAALTVALSNALCQVAQTDADATRIAFAAHRQFQQGLGSGVDVACSSMGGLIAYTMGGATARRLDWPVGLAMGVVWVGAPASTSDKLEQLRRQAARASRAALVLGARRLAAAWEGGEAEAILDEYRDYTNVLQEFSVDHELGIFDAGHAELTAAAARAGVVYKPCGAGGGDTGVILAADQSAIEAFAKIAQDLSALHLDMHIDENGVLVERGNT